jgi:hypothetical protein
MDEARLVSRRMPGLVLPLVSREAHPVYARAHDDRGSAQLLSAH